MAGGKSRKTGRVTKRLIAGLKASAKGKTLRPIHPKPLLIETNPSKTDYAKVNRLRLFRIHRGHEIGTDPYGDKERLDHIVEEIKHRVRICKKEIYFIGELLVDAKKIVSHGKFQQWIADTFKDFSYETANNFMNVYKACLGNSDIVSTMKASVLYQISSPGFPSDLREYIFESGDLELSKISNSNIRELLQKYKAGELGMEAEEVNRFFRQNRRWAQLAHVHDCIALCMRDITNYMNKISTVRGMLYDGYPTYRDGIGQDEEAGKKIFEVISRMDAFRSELDELQKQIMDMGND